MPLSLPQFVAAVALMLIVTYLPRVLPILLLSQRSLPKPLVRWLSYIPVAVLAALLGPVLLAPENSLEIGITQNPGLWVALPVFAIAYFSRSLFATAFAGMALIALARLFL